MNLNKIVAETLEALDRAKAIVPQNGEYLSNHENIMARVIEMECMPN